MPKKIGSILGVPKFNVFPMLSDQTYNADFTNGCTVIVNEESGKVSLGRSAGKTFLAESEEMKPPSPDPSRLIPPAPSGRSSPTMPQSRNSPPPLGANLKKEGWLTKQGNIVKNWKRRWFSLSLSGHLLYYELLPDGTKSKGSIPLGEYMLEIIDVPVMDGKLERKFCFKLRGLKGKRDFLICADDEVELKQWILAIQMYTVNVVLDSCLD